MQRVGTIQWHETRHKSRQFVRLWAGEQRERSEKDSFWNDLLKVFGVDRRQVARFEAVARRYSTGRHGFIDVFWPGRLLAEHKSAGEDLDKAMEQALDYLPGMEPYDVPQIVVVCDFAEFVIRDLDTGQQVRFPLEDLPNRIDLFGILAGRGRGQFDTEEDVNLYAAQLLSNFGDALREMGYGDHERRMLLTRVLFCLFADDAAVWPTGLFEDFLRLRTRQDGSDLGPQLAYLFQLLNNPSRRVDLPDEVKDFTYINGGLFAERIPIAECDTKMRATLLAAARFNWAVISPAIFGSMFQNAMTPADRRQLGAHYTTEHNILRTIRPLFLDDLEARLAAAGEDLGKLRAFRDYLGTLTFFDPACGCGNFLVIAYRELRRVELECLVRIRDVEARARRRRAAGPGQTSLNITWESVVHVGQFYGIEIEEWPCRIAETAMHLMDHLANQQLSEALGSYYARFPISDTAHIHNGNALRIAWADVLAANECAFVLSNPPFAGQRTRAADQTADLRHVWGGAFSRWHDYVTGWYRLLADYLRAGPQCRAAFVSTNSITQGEQVARIWQTLLNHGLQIDFAHQTFAWTSEARGRAQVHVVIIGLSLASQHSRKQLYSYATLRGEPTITNVEHINPYLLPLPDVLVESRTTPLSPVLPPVQYGNKPADGRHLSVVDPADLPPAGDPAHRYIRRVIGAEELTHGIERYCIWMDAPDADAVRRSPFLRQRLDAVRQFRLDSSAPDTRAMANRPWRFFRVPQPTTSYLAIPRHVTRSRTWFTVALQPPEVIATDALYTVIDPDGFLFSVLSSALFMAWMRVVGGAIKSDPRFSAGIVYNTFPLPPVAPELRQKIIDAGDKLRDARGQHTNLALVDMYETLATPPDVLAAHHALDRAVDQAFRARATLSSVTDRMIVLFPAYEQLLGTLTTSTPTRRRRRNRS